MAKNPVLAARQDGYNEAVRKLRQQLLNKLEEMYMDPEVERGTPMAEAILKVTRTMSEMLQEKK